MMDKVSENYVRFFPLVLVIYEISNYLANDAYLPAMPDIAQQLQTTSHLVQLTLTVFFLGNATMQLILGPISDRYGYRPVLLSGGVIFISTTLICALNRSIYTLLIARFFQGAAVTSMIVAGYATIHAMYDQLRAIKTLAWMNSVTILAPALGPLFGAIILLLSDWRWIFIILAIWASLGWIALFRLMPEMCKNPVPLDIPTIFKQYWRVVTNWNYTKPVLIVSLLMAAMIAWISASPFLIINTFHYSAIGYGLMQGLVFGAFILGTYFVRRFIEKIQLQKMIKISMVLAIMSGFLSFILSLLLPNYIIDIIFPMMVLAFSAGLSFPILNRVAIEASEEAMGIKMALYASFIGMGALLGSVIISSFYTGTVFGLSSILFAFSVSLLPFSQLFFLRF